MRKVGKKQLCVIQITQDRHQMEVHQEESKTPHASQTQNIFRRKTYGKGVYMNKEKKTNQEDSTV